MPLGLLGRKIGMTQVYEPDGTALPVTVIEAGPCTVLQVRSKERDGYEAVQLGFADKPRRLATKPERGQVAQVGAEPKRFVRELRAEGMPKVGAGDVLTVDVFKDVARVDVVGISKGRGFTGVMKRHHFGGLRATHGVKRKHRSGGSIGASADPARVMKGKKMAGRSGGVRSTVRYLKVVRVDLENNLLLVCGGVPGPNGGFLIIRETNRY